MEPTPRALALADPIGGALDRLGSALDSEPAFEQSTTRRCFTLTMSDASAARLLPRLILPAALLREDEKCHLAVYELPVAVPDVAIHMAWRARRSQDPALIWLRKVVAASM